MATSDPPRPELRQCTVELGNASYPILVGTQWLGAIGDSIKTLAPDVSHAMVVCDAAVGSTYAEVVRHSIAALGVRTDLCTLPSGEATKSAQQLMRLWDWMLACQADRRSLLVAVGGGVVGDVAGFAAATYQRGIRLVQVPTTLLSQVDSSVGGKTAVNLPAAKNMVGAFWQPILVAIDTHSLGSLPQREYLSGFAEVVKYGVIERPEFFNWLEAQAATLVLRGHDAIQHAVIESCLTKAAVVGADERETSGRRAILNYGHTFAHAIEATAGYGTFLHGEAVAIGMQMAAQCAVRRGLLESQVLDRQTSLLEQLELPTTWPAADTQAMLTCMRQDKKNTHGTMRLILPTKLGQVELVDDVSDEQICHAIEACRV
ncbi:3-dehydroquinate synthase [Planctomycetaceae bacterium SH139]